MDEHTEPPTTIKEVGIHIGYMRNDINELKNVVANYTTVAATKADIELLKVADAALSRRIDNIEDWRDGLVGKVAGGAVLLLVAMVLAMYGIDKFF